MSKGIKWLAKKDGKSTKEIRREMNKTEKLLKEHRRGHGISKRKGGTKKG